MAEISKPTAEDTVRDAVADLAVCEAATPGPWQCLNPEDIPSLVCVVSEQSGRVITYVDRYDNPSNNPSLLREWKQDFSLMALARTALPHWINRAVAAEAEVASLADYLKQKDAQWLRTDWRTCPACNVDWPHPSETSGLLCPSCRVAYAVKALELDRDSEDKLDIHPSQR